MIRISNLDIDENLDRNIRIEMAKRGIKNKPEMIRLMLTEYIKNMDEGKE